MLTRSQITRRSIVGGIVTMFLVAAVWGLVLLAQGEGLKPLLILLAVASAVSPLGFLILKSTVAAVLDQLDVKDEEEPVEHGT